MLCRNLLKVDGLVAVLCCLEDVDTPHAMLQVATKFAGRLEVVAWTRETMGLASQEAVEL